MMQKVPPRTRPPAATFSQSVAGLDGFTGRNLVGYEEFLAASALYSRVFDYESSELSLNPNLLTALAANGGSVVGVFTPDDELVGFAYGFAGRDNTGAEYHYSQAAVISPQYQGRGLARELKLLQSAVARSFGCEIMRWTFDPQLTRNGRFNFSTLGAIGIGFYDDFYGRPGTNRVLAEWTIGEQLDPYEAIRDTPTPQLDTQRWATRVEQDGRTWIPLSATPHQHDGFDYRPKLAATLRELFAEDFVLIDCRRIDSESAAYLAVPRNHDDEAARYSTEIS